MRTILSTINSSYLTFALDAGMFPAMLASCQLHIMLNRHMLSSSDPSGVPCTCNKEAVKSTATQTAASQTRVTPRADLDIRRKGEMILMPSLLRFFLFYRKRNDINGRYKLLYARKLLK